MPVFVADIVGGHLVQPVQKQQILRCIGFLREECVHAAYVILRHLPDAVHTEEQTSDLPPDEVGCQPVLALIPSRTFRRAVKFDENRNLARIAVGLVGVMAFHNADHGGGLADTAFADQVETALLLLQRVAEGGFFFALAGSYVDGERRSLCFGAFVLFIQRHDPLVHMEQMESAAFRLASFQNALSGIPHIAAVDAADCLCQTEQFRACGLGIFQKDSVEARQIFQSLRQSRFGEHGAIGYKRNDRAILRIFLELAHRQLDFFTHPVLAVAEFESVRRGNQHIVGRFNEPFPELRVKILSVN